MGSVIETGFSGRGLHFYGLAQSQVVDGALNVHDALTTAGLDWQVEKIPAGHKGERGEFVPAGAKFSLTRRSDNGAILGQVGNKYTVFQNERAFAFADELLGFGAEFHAAGAFNGGANVFLIAKLPEGIKVQGEEEMDLYLDLLNTHNGSGSISGFATPVRRVCTNQTRLMVADAVSSFKIRHTVNAGDRVKQAAQMLRLVDRYKEELEAGITRLQDTEMTLDEVTNFIKDWAGVKEGEKTGERVQRNVLETYLSSDMVPRGSAWGAVNAITETLLHNPARRSGGESRWASTLDGPNQRSIERASRMLLRSTR